MKLKVETLEKKVQEMTESIVVLQNELNTKKYVNTDNFESDSINVSNSNEMGKSNSFKTNSEHNKEEIQDDQQLKCEHCKRKVTMKKHMNTKHNKQIVSCKHCEEKFNSAIILELHIADKHQVVQGSSSLSKAEDDESFVFCESMLDEFINSSS